MNYKKTNTDGSVIIYNGIWIKTDDKLIINPTDDILISNGYESYTQETPTIVDTEPNIYDIVTALKTLQCNTVLALSDAEALNVSSLFPTWESKLGLTVTVGTRLWYNNNLYKVQTEHTVQEDWNPESAASLFVVITQEASGQTGTLDNPIDWVNGMESTIGLYYKENNLIYECIRTSGSPLYYTIADLISAGYFKLHS